MEPPQPQKSSLFPNIHRFITEHGKLVVISFVSGLVLIGIAIEVIRLNTTLLQLNSIEQRNSQVRQELEFWQAIVRQYGNYRDAYFRIANLHYQLGENEQALKSLEKVFSLDPNFTDGYVLGDKIKAE